MLNPEAAEERLRQFRVPSRHKARLRELPPALRDVGLSLLGLDGNGKQLQEWQARQAAQVRAGQALHALPADQRRQLFDALLPSVSAPLEAAWQLLGQLPYQTGYARRAFRAPRDLRTQIPRRTEWLLQLVSLLENYEQNIEWVAAWAPYIGNYWTGPLGILLAGAIESGGPEGEAVYQTLMASARGEHEIGAMGRHVVGALLCASRPDGWEFVERLLLAAQRQEGLRQTIMESVDETHPEAFRRMLRLILEQDLLRFSAVIRAVDVWFGFGLEASTPVLARSVVTRVLEYLESPGARAAGLSSEEPEARYLALWSLAFEDAHAALGPAAEGLHSESVELRFVSAYLLGELALPEARELLLPALDDPDLRIAVTAFGALHLQDEDEAEIGESELVVRANLFEGLERLAARCPEKPKVLPQIAWDWMNVTAHRTEVVNKLPGALVDRSPERLIPHISAMEPYTRGRVVDLLAETKKPSPAVRQALLALTGDPSEWARRRALEAVEKLRLQEGEAEQLERLLTRKASDLRQGVLKVLLHQPDEAALASADRLLGAKHALQRQAALELLQQMTHAERQPDTCRKRAVEYRERAKLTTEEEQVLQAFLEPEAETISLDDALGLMDPTQRTRPEAPRNLEDAGFKGLVGRIFGKQPFVLRTEASLALVKSLDALVHEHREAEIEVKHWDGSINTEVLGNVRWSFPQTVASTPIEQDLARLPLRELWESWYEKRPDTTRDPDGLELLRAIASLTAMKGSNPRYSAVVPLVLHWLLRLHPPQGAVDFLVCAAETSVAQIPEGVLTKLPKPDEPWDRGWRAEPKRVGWVTLARSYRRFFPEQWQPEQHARFWKLLRWIDEPGFGQPRMRPDLTDAVAAFRAGAATEADLYDLLLGPRGESTYDGHFRELNLLSGRKSDPLVEGCPALQEIVDRCRRRILEIELKRGDLPTPASEAATALRYAGGAEELIQLLQAFGKLNFIRGYARGDADKAYVFSHLVRATFPSAEDTPDRFVELAAAGRIPEKRLIEVAFYAPQWAAHVERALGWPEFAEAVWWIHAHTKDEQWSVAAEIRETWTAQVAERTPLAAQSLVDGAVDVAWFQRVYAALGAERWSAAMELGAKYASGGGGHKRAELFADAMLGRLDQDQLRRDIEEKRKQDAVRALGLLPLPEGETARQEVLERYQVIQEFIRGSRQFGSQRQASEKLAASIALENLARTAGYADPIRLEWAMEARAVEDLAAGPVSATSGEVTVTLSINEWGEPDLSITKKGKPVKAVPPAAKKDPAIAALVDRRKEVERQASRMRLSLEAAMCRGDRFTGAELRELCAHPVLAPMLRSLVFLGDGKAGYPADGGRFLAGLNGESVELAVDEWVAIAHPYDLYRSGDWHLWQQDCFRHERIQPFKQVFRELYVLTEAEQKDGTASQRYAGHQIARRQAMALLGKRGWVTNPEEGEVRRTFHDQGLTASIDFDYGFTTPAEVEGLTIDTVSFSRRGEWKPLPLAEIPPRVFSEVMRDLDLVVSVAHQGGVDPEATASTVEMRAALLRETCSLLGLDNVRLKDSHALIDGKLGTYSLHLGSGVVHRQPGGHLCIVPVHSQHRGRIFLPFADSDPRTAEVLSKTLLLARDQEIKDPTILEQIFASR